MADLLLKDKNSVRLGSKLFEDECCSVYGRNDLCVSSDPMSSPPVWKLAKATLACHNSSFCFLVFLVSDRLHPSFRRIRGKFKYFPGNKGPPS